VLPELFKTDALSAPWREQAPEAAGATFPEGRAPAGRPSIATSTR
jgi:hypothetical protein